MSKIYMATIPRKYASVEDVLDTFWLKDVKKWQIGKETGKTGYEHLQIRFRSSGDLETIRKWEIMKKAHVERAEIWTDYEKKDGEYWTSDDTAEQLEVRFGEPTNKQKEFLELLKNQNIREIDVWYDPEGGAGKSWFCNYLHETGKGYYCPPYLDTVKQISQHIADGYNGEGIIVIDIPRSQKWTKQLYIGIEAIKDGLVVDTRYHSRIKNVRGVKLLVMTNNYPKLDKLSADRWRINGEKYRNIN